MRRATLCIAVAAGVGALAIPAQAGMEKFENEFEGVAERDPYTYVGFDVVKKQGEKKVAKVTARLSYACDDGDGGRADDRVDGKLDVGPDGKFAGTLRGTTIPTRGGARDVKYRFKGKFTSKRKAKGTINATLRFTPVSSPRGDVERVRCYTGILDWKAKRGAEVEPPGPF
jgi:hypothetical protein